MKTSCWWKRVLWGSLGIACGVPCPAVNGVHGEGGTPVVPQGEEQKARSTFSKDELIAALREMYRRPVQVRTICAMCYKVAVVKEIEFTCDRCGRSTTCAVDSNPGILARNLPYIKRSLSSMPYTMTVDSTGLCPACGSGKDKVLVMRVRCFACGKEFSWEVRKEADVKMLHWLFRTLPIREIDFHRGEGPVPGGEQTMIREGAQYIRNHVFCPACRGGIDLGGSGT